MANTVSSLQQKILGLTAGRVDIMASNDEFKSTTQILRELASVWDTMTDIQQAASLEALGGKRQANILAAIITNFSTVEDVIASSEGSAGSALEENEKIIDSFQGRLNQLTSTVQTKWNEALDSDTIKEAIQLATKFVQTLDFENDGILNFIGELIKGLSKLLDFLGDNNFGYTIISFLGANFLRKNNFFSIFDNLKSKSEETVEIIQADIDKIGAEINKKTNKLGKQGTIGRAKTLTEIKTLELQKEQRLKDLEKAKEKQVEAMKLSESEQKEVAESFDIDKLRSEGKTDDDISADSKISESNKKIEEGSKKLEAYNSETKETSSSIKDMTAAISADSASTTTNTSTKVVNKTATERLNVGVEDGIDNRIASGNAIDIESQDLAENTAEKVKNNVVTESSASSQGKFSASMANLKTKFKEFGKQAFKTVGTMLIMQGVMELASAITKTINEATEDTAETYEELHEHFEVMTSDLSDQKSKLQSLESEFDNIKEQIREIQKLGSLSFAKEEELENLKKQGAELERQIEMQKIVTRNQQLKTNTAALDAATAYLDESAETDKARTEFIEEETEKTTRWTDSIGNILTGAGVLATALIGWTGVGIGVGAGLVALGQGVKHGGKAIAKNQAENKYDAQQTNKQTIDNYEAKRKELQDEIDAAYAAGDTEKWKDAQQKLNDYEGMVADNMGQIQEYISSVDYSTLTEQEKARYEELNRILNKYSLANGGSVTNAVGSVLDYDKFQHIGYQFNDIQNQLKNGDISSSDATQRIKELLNTSPLLRKELTDLGLDIEKQVIPSFVQLGEAMKEDMSLMDSLDKITAVTDAFDSLGGAVQEFREEGRASTGTLESLKEKFGDLDEFENLYKVLATGEGNLEEEIANVANAYVGQIQALSGLTDEELSIMVSRLKALGVLNAEEVLMARRTAQEQLEARGLTYGIDLSNYGTAEQAKVAIATAAGLNIASIADDEINSLADKYGVDLANYATKEEKKIAIAQARAKAEADIDRQKLEKEYRNKDIEYAAYMDGLKRIDSSINFSTDQDAIWNIVDNAFKGFDFNFDGQIGIGSDFDEKTGMSNEQSKAWEELLKKHQAELDTIAHEKELIQAEIDRAEARGEIASERYYTDLIALENKETEALKLKQKEIEDFYNANKSAMSSEELEEYQSEWRETELAIKESTTAIYEHQGALREIDSEYFNRVSEDIDAINEEIEFMHGLLEDEPVADENGNWSNEALTRLGLYTQQMEKAAFETQRAKDELAELQSTTSEADKNTDWYRQREEELTQAIYDGVEAYNSSKDGIVQLNEARVEAIKEGIEKEIEAMNDLIENKKEALDAERDLFDFKKNIEEQNKSIAETERKLAALSGSTAAEDVAERRRLEAELAEQKGNLNDTYYDHSMTAQQNALDEEGRYFEEAQQRRIESLEAMLENTEELIVNSMMDVMLNADTVHQTLNEQANTYGVTLSEELTKPWLDASAQAIAWKAELDKQLTASELALITHENGAVTAFSSGVATKLGGSWDTVKTKTQAYSDFLTGNELKKDFSGAITTFVSYLQKIVDKWNEIRNAAAAATSVTPIVPSGDAGGGNGNNGGKTENPPKQDPPKKEEPKKTTTPTRQSTPTRPKFKKVGDLWSGVGHTGVSIGKKTYNKALEIEGNDAIYYPYTNGNGYQGYIRKGEGYTVLGNGKMDIHSFKPIYQKYAKGSLGVEKDQWAITDEPQFGDELVLVPGSDGNLSFIRKGTGIVPADMTKKLFDLAEMPISNFGGNTIKAVVPNIQSTNQNVNITFDALVKTDYISKDIIPEVEDMVTKQLNNFTRQLNYSLKKVGGR